MNDFDPTTLIREGVRLAEVRYQAEILFRTRISEEFTKTDERNRQIASWAIRTACLFEQEWLIASMREADTHVDQVDDDLEDQLIWEIMKIQEPLGEL
jgi:hypothetical protein